MDLLTGCALFVLLIIVIRNWTKITSAADDLGNAMNDLPIENELQLFKKEMDMQIRIMKNKIEALEVLINPK